MLYLIFFYFMISLVCFLAGLTFYTIIDRFHLNSGTAQKPLISYLLTGLIMVTSCGQWVALFSPLHFSSLLAVLLILAVLFLIYRKEAFEKGGKILAVLRQQNILFFLCFACFLFMILILNAGPTIMDDTDSYHIQMVKWIREYGSVPGIANLHLRFGFNSSWFSSIAWLCQPLKGVNTYLVLNGLLSVWICHYLLEKIFRFFSGDQSTKKSALAAAVILIFCFISWPMIRGSACNTNYDFITTCCIIVLFAEYGFSSPANPSLEWLIWPCYLFTVRMINYPLLLLGLFYFISSYRLYKIKTVATCAFTIILVIIPFIARNLILSGYAFFPIYQVDIFHPDWKADKPKVIEIVQYIKYFNRVNPQNQPMAVTMLQDFPQWTRSWYRYLSGYDKVLILFSLPAYAILLFFRRKIFSHSLSSFNILFFACVMILQLISWFFTAPDPRFAYGPLLFPIFIVISFSPVLLIRTPLYLAKSSIICIMCGIIFYAANKPVKSGQYRNWVKPYELPVPPVKAVSVDGIELHIPDKILDNWNPRCYDAALPCLYHVDPRLEARGKTIKDGFRIGKTDSMYLPEGEYKIKN